MRLASILLCNDELYSKIDELYPVDDSADEAIKRLEELKICEIMKKIANEIIIDTENIISMIARNFYLIDKSKIKTISKPLFHSIISNDHLRIETEDWLFDVITDYFEGEDNEEESDFSDITSFIEEVRLRKLSDSKFKEMLQRIEAGKITGNLWRNICDRICRDEDEDNDDERSQQRYVEEENKPSSESARVFSFDGQECNRLNGIINFLAKEAGGNVHEKGVVSVTASSELKSSLCAKNVVDFDDIESRLCTNDEENSWLKYDFKELKVRPTHYSIRSKPYGPGIEHPMHWVIEGSNSGNDEDWTVIDRRSGVKSLNAKSVVCTFDIQQQPVEFYRYLRLRHTGKHSSGKYNLGLSSLEYFGSVI